MAEKHQQKNIINNSITFTIAIPAFKKAFLNECIQSILLQTYNNYEIIIVNDNSPEDLDSIINSFNDKRIRYFKNKIGFGAYDVVKNWNKCLEYASGKYIICMGDDDKLLPNCLSDYIELINKYPTLDIYHTQTEIINEKSEIIDLQEPRPEYESVYSMIWYRWNGRKQYIGDFLFKVDTLKENGGFYILPTGCCSDEISAWIAAKKQGIANTLVAGFQYRDNTESISRNKKDLREKALAFKLAKMWYNKFLKNETELNFGDKIYCNKIKNRLNGYIYSYIIYCVKMDIRVGGIKSAIYWLKNRKSYGLNPFYIVKCLIQII